MLARALLMGGEILLGDAFPTVVAAFSLRKLRAAYSGNCIKVRRSSDNTDLDIGFAGNVLDTAALLAFAGAGDAFIDTWYDQSAGGYNVTQTTNDGYQPQIVASGAVHTENGKPSILFDGSNDYLTAATASNWTYLHYAGAGNDQVNSAFVVARAGAVTDPENIYAIYGTTGTITQPGAFLYHDTRSSVPRDRVLVHQVGPTPVTAVTTNAQNAGDTAANVLFQASVIGDPGNATAASRSELATNGGTARANNVSAGADSSSPPFRPLQVGAFTNSGSALTSFLVGAISELVFYSTSQAANRAAIYDNQRRFYGTP